MIVIAAVIIGAILGWRRAGQLGGTRADRIHSPPAFSRRRDHHTLPTSTAHSHGSMMNSVSP